MVSENEKIRCLVDGEDDFFNLWFVRSSSLAMGT